MLELTLSRLFWLLLLLPLQSVALDDITLPGLGEDKPQQWLPVNQDMSLPQYRAATRNNIRVMGSSVNEYLSATGIPRSMVGVAGSTMKLLSGEEITLFNSQGLSVNTNQADGDGGAFLNYSLGW